MLNVSPKRAQRPRGRPRDGGCGRGAEHGPVGAHARSGLAPSGSPELRSGAGNMALVSTSGYSGISGLTPRSSTSLRLSL